MPSVRLVGSSRIEETRIPAIGNVVRLGVRKEYRSLLRGSENSHTEVVNNYQL